MSNIIIKKNELPLTGSKSYDDVIKLLNRDVDLTPDGIIKYFKHLRKIGTSVSTINHKIAALKKSLTILLQLPSRVRGKLRSIFYKGIAEAMADQWG